LRTGGSRALFELSYQILLRCSNSREEPEENAGKDRHTKRKQEDTPVEAGLGFAVALDKGEFNGRDAALAERERGGPERRLCCLTLVDPLAVCLGSEPVRVGGEVVGRVTSGGYGFAVGRSIAFAYLPAAQSEVGSAVEVEVFGEWVPGEIVRDPLYDPAGATIRA